MVKFEDVKITNKVLGKGKSGSVFLAKDSSKNKYAIKIQKLLKKNLVDDSSSQMWREIHFATEMNKKYPQFFVELLDFKIDDNCTYIHVNEARKNKKPKTVMEEIYEKELLESHYCSIKLWSFVDMNLYEYVNSKKKLDKTIYYDFLIQVCYIIHLMNKEGFLHTDLHMQNIGMKKTDDESIKIFNCDIPTHKYKIQIIDFELILHKNYELRNWEKRRMQNNSDMFHVIQYFLYDFNDFEKKYELENIHKLMDFQLTKEYVKILTPILCANNFAKDKLDFLLKNLYKIMFYENWQKELLGDKFVEAIPPRFLVPMEQIIYIMQNLYDPKKITKYLVKNINQ
jgi:serine/threonine protein kinase